MICSFFRRGVSVVKKGPILIILCLLSLQVVACEYLVGLRKERLPDLDAEDAAEVSPEVDGEDAGDTGGEDVAGSDSQDIQEEEIYCEDNDDCDDGHPCTDDQCELTQHRCRHLLSTEGTVCRPSANACDADETCDGSSVDCPADEARADGFVCSTDPRSICMEGSCEESECGDDFVDTGAGESCEPPLVGDCNGDCHFACGMADPDCPDDENICNGEEYCDVGPGECASRYPLDDGTECGTDPRLICIAQSCQESICGDGYTDEEGRDEECDDANDVAGDGCENDCTYSCHEHSDCDDGHACTEDLCDMTGTHMCSNALSPDSVVCRPDGGECDVPEYCTGSDEDCPEDVRKGGETTCRDADGVCDIPEYCGGDVHCPEDRYKVAEICRPTAGVCDAPDSCHGDSPDCPADVYKGSDFECREAAFDCDLPEVCDGESTACPADERIGEGEECNDGDPCTMNDRCDAEGECMGDPGGFLVGVVASAGGEKHTCTLDDYGAVICWGSNLEGQLGDGESEDSLVPVQVEGLESGVAEIAAGYNHTCALLESGGVKCWGANSQGQLGDGSTVNKDTPVDVSGLLGGVTAITAGQQFTCAILSMGGARCWGVNSEGQLGDSSVIRKLTPTDVSGMSSGVTQIAAGGRHACAVHLGDMKCWGHNGDGQLGDGSTTMRMSPVEVTGLSSVISQIACGGEHTCALLDSGTVKCWGNNAYGQVGDGSTEVKHTPTDVIGVSMGTVTMIAAGVEHTCAGRLSGPVFCWGNNVVGAIGDGSRDDRLEPVEVGGINDVRHVMAGDDHSCAVQGEEGLLLCWGSNAYGKLGNGRTSVVRSPMRVHGLDGIPGYVACGSTHTCTTVSGSDTRCWGDNMYGELGNGSYLLSMFPVASEGFEGPHRQVEAGLHFTCALNVEGTVRCWGMNDLGQLGDGTTVGSSIPVQVSGLGIGVVYISCGMSHACAVLGTGVVRCWGDNSTNQLGNDTMSYSTEPVDVEGLDTPMLVSAGSGHTCVVVEGPGINCWGNNSSGQLGDGTTINRPGPVDVSVITEEVRSLTAGGNHTCAIVVEGAMCWGENSRGQLGDNSTENRLTPVAVDGMDTGAHAIVAGGEHTCAIVGESTLKCWGSNFQGQLGVGVGTYSRVPLLVGLDEWVRSVGAGEEHTCAIVGESTLKCWGNDLYGQVSGFFTGYPFPVGCRL